MKTRIICFIMTWIIFCAITVEANAQKSQDLFYLAQDSRKLADIQPDAELWILTSIRTQSGKDVNHIPQSITFIHIVDRSEKKRQRKAAPIPDGTPIKIHLNHRIDGNYQTVYYDDLRKIHTTLNY